jgi:hypothetical protein
LNLTKNYLRRLPKVTSQTTTHFQTPTIFETFPERDLIK